MNSTFDAEDMRQKQTPALAGCHPEKTPAAGGDSGSLSLLSIEESDRDINFYRAESFPLTMYLLPALGVRAWPATVPGRLEVGVEMPRSAALIERSPFRWFGHARSVRRDDS